MQPYTCVVHPAFFNLGSTELVVVLVVAVILFGGRLPKIARDLGKVFFEFRKNIRDLQSEFYRQDYSPPPSRGLPETYDHAPYEPPADVEAEVSDAEAPPEEPYPPPPPEGEEESREPGEDRPDARPQEGEAGREPAGPGTVPPVPGA